MNGKLFCYSCKYSTVLVGDFVNIFISFIYLVAEHILVLLYSRAVARVSKRGFGQIFFVGALLDPSQIQLGGLGSAVSSPSGV